MAANGSNLNRSDNSGTTGTGCKRLGKTGSKEKLERPQIKSTVETHTKNDLKCAAWNIFRGLTKRRTEIINLLKNEKIDVLFLTECDAEYINEKNPYTVENYKTLYPLLRDEDEKTRIICLVHERLAENVEIRHDLMSSLFPMIWLQITRADGRRILICGAYREWDQDGKKSIADQAERLGILSEQLETAASDCRSIRAVGSPASLWRTRYGVTN